MAVERARQSVRQSAVSSDDRTVLDRSLLPDRPMHVVVMGVAGCGKTTLAQYLQQLLTWPYAEADDFHPAANIAKMAAGHPLTDEDRWPWLRSLEKWMSEHADDGLSTIVTCSALKRSYRDILRQAHGDVIFVELDANVDTLRKRMTQREHFMPVSLLHSQVTTLEPLDADERGFRLDSEASPQELAATVIERLGLRSRAENQ
jgi:carbohydrate kinase (thermoresistant glucokinase family)